MFHKDPLCRRGRRAATLRDRSPSSWLKRKLRASVNRDRSRMKDGHEIFHHPGSSPRFPSRRSGPVPALPPYIK